MEQENTDVRISRDAQPIRITYVGTATVKIEVAGLTLLTDPVFDPAGSRYRVGRTDLVTHTNLQGPALAASEIGPIDVALVSHDHHKDNLDRTGRDLLREVPNVLTTASGAERLSQRHKIPARGLVPWQSVDVPTSDGSALRITATPAQHGPRWMLPIVGDVIGFALEHPSWAGQALWISGDTVFFPGLKEIARRFTIGIALLHVGAARFGLTGPIRYTFDAAEMVRTLDLLHPALALPIHFEGWSHFREGRAEIEAALEAAGHQAGDHNRRLIFTEAGETRELTMPPPQGVEA